MFKSELLNENAGYGIYMIFVFLFYLSNERLNFILIQSLHF